MIMERLLFVYNPNAGMGKIKEKLSDVIEVFSENEFEVIAYPTKKQGDAKEKVLEYLKEDKCDRIVCAGGDGTIDEVANAIMESGKSIKLGCITAGTTNDFGYSLKIPKDMVEAARLAVTGGEFLCDIGSINGYYFTYTAAFGIFSDVSYDTPQNMKNAFGRAAYILEGISKLASVKTYRIKAEYNNEIVEGEFIYGMLANSYSVGGFKGITGKDVVFDDGKFEMLLIRKPKSLLDLNEIVFKLLKGDFNSDIICYARVSKVHITCEGELPWSLDGEDGGSIPDAEIIVHEKAMRYICIDREKTDKEVV